MFTLWGTFWVSPMLNVRLQSWRLRPSSNWTGASSSCQISLRTNMRQVHVAAARGWCHCTRSPHRCGVVLLCLSRDRLYECSAMHRVTCNLCWLPCWLSSALVLVHGLVTYRGRSRGRCRGWCRGRCSSCWYVPSPSPHQLGHFVHLLCSV